ncbi:hypothetical protein M3P05_04790 [Sansalvadorimonas sp. 2012CJ34-2]|uniref:VOC domain-containing protein n=1 Tax=Parendozoicomonas callyspongiae TaxID=2942213 RepID=A0ABT0PD08_9GAMM|nr:hypothetical protein [Sansalvadorimonas sp. 2012CJ34-2]MCL6269262.1 hypothetical protein [Sansalvadorimonas sp. 2012CJ34-2]
MRTFSHIGIPTDKIHGEETHNVEGGFHITDFEQSPSRVEWLRCEEKCGLPEMLQTVAHVAYQVDDLDKELEGANVLLEPWMANEHLRIAFIIEDDAPVELMEAVH